MLHLLPVHGSSTHSLYFNTLWSWGNNDFFPMLTESDWYTYSNCYFMFNIFSIWPWRHVCNYRQSKYIIFCYHYWNWEVCLLCLLWFMFVRGMLKIAYIALLQKHDHPFFLVFFANLIQLWFLQALGLFCLLRQTETPTPFVVKSDKCHINRVRNIQSTPMTASILEHWTVDPKTNNITVWIGLLVETTCIRFTS